MEKTSAIGDTTKTVSEGMSRYGTREPQIEVRLPRGSSHRLLLAALHQLAAKVELATPRWECWLVQIERMSNERGRVYLELFEGTPAEAERGVALLHRIVGLNAGG